MTVGELRSLLARGGRRGRRLGGLSLYRGASTDSVSSPKPSETAASLKPSSLTPLSFAPAGARDDVGGGARAASLDAAGLRTSKVLAEESNDSAGGGEPGEGGAKGAGCCFRFSPPPSRQMTGLVFLSARPHAYKDYTESHSYNLFRKLLRRGMLHSMPTLLAGQMTSSATAALLGIGVRLWAWRRATVLSGVSALLLATTCALLWGGGASVGAVVFALGWLLSVAFLLWGTRGR